MTTIKKWGHSAFSMKKQNVPIFGNGPGSQGGYVLVTVMVAAFLVASVAYVLSQSSVLSSRMAAADLDRDAARYVAEAGIRHALWLAQRSECSNYPSLVDEPFGAHSYSASPSASSGSPLAFKSVANLDSGATASLKSATYPVYAASESKSVVLQPDPALGKDTWITSGQPGKNAGAHPALPIDDTNERALLQFDLSAIPASAHIDSATISLYAKLVSGSAEVGAYRVTAPWIEGSCGSGGSCIADGATWLTSDGLTAWATPGGEYMGSSESVTVVDASESWFTWDVTAAAAQWHSGATPNYGLLLKVASGTGFDASMQSSDSPDASARPKLTISYSCECGAVCGSGSVVDVPVTSASDDAEESSAFGVMYIDSTDLELAVDGLTSDLAGIRFAAVGVPYGATISNAYVQFQVDESDSGLANLTVHGIAESDTATFTTDNSNISSRPLTISSVNWVPPAWSTPGDRGLDQRTPSLTAIVQELVNQPGWSSDSALGIVISGTGTRTAEAYEGDSSGAPLLHIEFTGGSEASGSVPLLFVVGNTGGPGMTAEELAHQALLESWGYTVEIIDDDASQAEFDAAVANNDVIFTTNDITASRLGTKVVDATIGVVTSEANLSDEFGMASSIGWDSGTAVEINDNGHYVTSPFTTGLLTVLSTNESLAYVTGTLSADLGELASSSSGFGVVTLEAGAAMYGGGNAAGRRIQLPWGGNGFNPNNLNADGLTILKRAIEWGAGAGGALLDFQVAGGNDDAEELSSGGTMYLTSTDLELADNLAASGQPTDIVGIRFTGVTIPQGTAITNAYIQFQVDEVSSGAASLTVEAEAADDAAQFTSTPFNLTSRPRTTAFALWAPPDWTTIGEQGIEQRTVDLSAVIQEVVDRPGWASGNALAVIVSGSGTRTAEAYDGDVAGAPKLHIEYGSGGGAGGGGGGSGDGGGPTSGTFRDEFNTKNSYAGSDGTLNWTTDWLEINESDGAGSGDEALIDDIHKYQLRIRDNDGDGEGVQREADLSGCGSASLSFVYRRDSFDNVNDYVTVDISANGGSSWTELDRLQGPANETTYQSTSYSISSHIAANTRVRFLTSPGLGDIDELYLDDVEITCDP